MNSQEMRKALRMTQPEIARMSHVSVRSVAYWDSKGKDYPKDVRTYMEAKLLGTKSKAVYDALFLYEKYRDDFEKVKNHLSDQVILYKNSLKETPKERETEDERTREDSSGA